MLQPFTTNVITHLKCYKRFSTNVKTIICSRDAKIENVLRWLGMACQDYFTHFEKSLKLGLTKSGYC